nr:tetratricopeptide repeat protein [Prochlorococcus sp. MIT 1307]
MVCFLFTNQLPVGASQLPQPLFEKAIQSSKDGDLISALERWDKFLELFPEDALAWSNRGNVRFALGDLEGAIADQTKSIDILPSEVDSHLNRGIAEEALQLWDEAAADYNWILQHDPEDPSAMYNLGNVRVAQTSWAEAEVLFQNASLGRKGFVMARSSKALMVYQLGDLDKAQSELRAIIRRYPMFADARAALTALLWHQGRFGEAESHWAAAVGLDSRYREKDWLLHIRRWPPAPANDLLAFLALEKP